MAFLFTICRANYRLVILCSVYSCHSLLKKGKENGPKSIFVSFRGNINHSFLIITCSNVPRDHFASLQFCCNIFVTPDFTLIFFVPLCEIRRRQCIFFMNQFPSYGGSTTERHSLDTHLPNHSLFRFQTGSYEFVKSFWHFASSGRHELTRIDFSLSSKLRQIVFPSMSLGVNVTRAESEPRFLSSCRVANQW